MMQQPKFIYIENRDMLLQVGEQYPKIKPFLTSKRSHENIFVFSTLKLKKEEGEVHRTPTQSHFRVAVEFITRYLLLLSEFGSEKAAERILKELIRNLKKEK